MKPLSAKTFIASQSTLRTMAGCVLAFALSLAAPAVGAGDDQVILGDQAMSSNAFKFSFVAHAGQPYAVETSVDLMQWGPLTNLVADGRSSWVVDREAARFQQRFYRIGVPPTPVTNMVFIPPGTFTMGSPESEVSRSPDEGPQTEVTISRGFWIGKYEVTQAEYEAIVGLNESHHRWNVRLPPDMVSWDMATNYCYKLTDRERAAGRLPPGYIYRLPTEAEWEYACRAGKSTPFGIGDGTSLSSTQANFDGNFPYGDAAIGPYFRGTTVVGSYVANAWGLYDMHGNVWEWCQDWYAAYPGGSVTDPRGPATGSFRVLRGGCWTSPGQGCRSAKRDNRSPGYRYWTTAFRVVLGVDFPGQ